MLTSSPSVTIDYNILDLDLNMSDHLPIIVKVICNDLNTVSGPKSIQPAIVTYLRWDRANLRAYYEQTRVALEPILCDLTYLENALDCLPVNDVVEQTNQIYRQVVTALDTCADLVIPRLKQNFFKFWWSEELKTLKEQSIATSRIWKDAGKPRFGEIFLNYNRSKKCCVEDELKRREIVKR